MRAQARKEQIRHDQGVRVIEVFPGGLVQPVQLPGGGYASRQDLRAHAPYEVSADGAAGMAGRIDVRLGLDSDIDQASLPEKLGQAPADSQVRAVRLRISDLAREQGLAAGPALIQTVQVTIDALASADVMPFWAAVLGYERRADSPDQDLIDPRWRGPSIWFQHMDPPRPQRSRFHIEVWVPPQLAEARVTAALAAGGRMVRDASPTWWTLADAEGNEVDVTSATGRD